MNSASYVSRLALAALVLVSGGLIGCPPEGGAGTRHAVLVIDRSLSVTERLCDSAAGLMEQTLAELNDAENATVLVLATGDGKTANEPVLVADYGVPRQEKVLEGRYAAQEKRAVLVAELRDKCVNLPRTRQTPLLLAIRRGIEHLKTKGCKPGSGCVLQVQTDGEENQERIPVTTRTTPSAKPASSVEIATEGIEVRFCGLAELASRTAREHGRFVRGGRRDAQTAARIQATLSGAFVNTSTVTFAPYCPKSTTGGTTARAENSR